MPLNIEELESNINFRENIKNISIENRRKYEYIWVAQLKNNSFIVQFNKKGEENYFSKVINQIQMNTVIALYWIPINNFRKGYKMMVSDCKELFQGKGMLRRGYIMRLKDEDTDKYYIKKKFAYFFGIKNDSEEQYFFINRKGETYVSNDFNFDIEKHLGGYK